MNREMAAPPASEYALHQEMDSILGDLTELRGALTPGRTTSDRGNGLTCGVLRRALCEARALERAVAALQNAYISGKASADVAAQNFEALRERYHLLRLMSAALARPQLAPVVRASYAFLPPKPTPFAFDYFRWYLPECAEREQEFEREYAGGSDIGCLLTNTGMAAITLAFEFVFRCHPRMPVRLYLVGNPYREGADYCRQLAGTRPGVTLILVADAAELSRRLASDAAQETTAPDSDVAAVTIIYGDVIENSATTRVFDVDAVLPALPPGNARGYLILDRTLVGPQWAERTGCAMATRPDWTILETESTTKYHQDGADMISGGALYLPQTAIVRFTDPVLNESGIRALWRLRGTMGWTPLLHSLAALPRPSHERLIRRIRQHQTNAETLAAIIADATETDWRVSHPSLTDHPDYELARRTGATGGLVFLSAHRAGLSSTGLIESVFAVARHEGLQLERRTSFGFNRTSLNPQGEPTLRISAGVEPRSQIERIGRVIAEALR